MYIKSRTKTIERMEPKNVFVQDPHSFFHSNICNLCPRRSTATLRKTSVECIEKQVILTIGLAYPSAPPKGDRFICGILTRTFSLTSDKVLILKKQPKQKSAT